MAHSRYLRQMARALRIEQQLTVDQLAARLSLPRSTIYYWVRDLPLRARGEPQARGATPRRSSERASSERGEAAYEQGLASFEELSAEPTFRDFVCIYLVQGEQRDRARVALTNSDPAVMRLASRWLRRLSDRVPFLLLQYAPGQGLKELRRFWGEATGMDPRAIRARDATRGEGPALPAPHGLLTVAVDDALLRARLHGWMHRARESWR